eukprot:m.144713 g.144713  ORF g.144713 m.144713 type:complete len:484 (-) comp16205_c0_seq1:1940-3391(-)
MASPNGKPSTGVRVVYCRYNQDEPVVKLERRSSKIGLFGTPHSVLKHKDSPAPEEPLGRSELQAHDRARKLAKEQARKYHKLASRVTASAVPITITSEASDTDSMISTDPTPPQRTSSVRASGLAVHPASRARSVSAGSNYRREAIAAQRQTTSTTPAVLQPLQTQAPTIVATGTAASPNTRRRAHSQSRALVLGSSQSLDSLPVDSASKVSSRQAGEERLATGDLPHLQFFPLWEAPLVLEPKAAKKRAHVAASMDNQCRHVHSQTQRMVGKVDQVIRKDAESHRKTLQLAAKRTLKQQAHLIAKQTKDRAEREKRLSVVQLDMEKKQKAHLAKVEQRHHSRLLDMMLTRLHVMEEVQLRHLADLRNLDRTSFEADAKLRHADADKELSAAVKAAKKEHKPSKYADSDGHKRSKGEVSRLAEDLSAQLVAEATIRRQQFEQSMQKARGALDQTYAAIEHNLQQFYSHQRDQFRAFGTKDVEV